MLYYKNVKHNYITFYAGNNTNNNDVFEMKFFAIVATHNNMRKQTNIKNLRAHQYLLRNDIFEMRNNTKNTIKVLRALIRTQSDSSFYVENIIVINEDIPQRNYVCSEISLKKNVYYGPCWIIGVNLVY